MNKFIALTLIMAISLILVSCQKEKSDLKSTDDVNITKTDNSIKFINKEFARTYNNCKPGEPNCTYIRLSYIEITDGKIKDKVNKLLTSQLIYAYDMPDEHFSTVEDMMSVFIRDYESFRKQMPSAPQVWTIDFKFSVSAETDKILCIGGELNSYLGGAHPSYVRGFLNFDKDSGDTISLGTLLKPGYEKKLNELIDKEFREMKGLKPGDDLSEKGDLFENKIELTHNFGVTKDRGLEFLYNPYEIAPYAVGPISVKLSNSELQDLLPEKSLLK
jgi:hypothetical protein